MEAGEQTGALFPHAVQVRTATGLRTNMVNNSREARQVLITGRAAVITSRPSLFVPQAKPAPTASRH